MQFMKWIIFLKILLNFYNERLKARNENNLIKSEMYKILMNSLYGKFGQKINSWLDIGEYDIKNDTDRIEQIYNVIQRNIHY